MSQFKPYPQYKESGVEWLGEVPAHWDIKFLKYCCDVFPSNVDKKSYEGEERVFLCNYTDVYYNDIINKEMEFMPATATEEQIKKFSLRAGDVIFTKDSETADDIAVAAYVPESLPKVVCGYHLSIARASSVVDGLFIKYFFDSQFAKSYFAISANGLTRVGLSQYATNNLPTPIPSCSEKNQIAHFLDHETARIDALIEEQQRLIALLKEKRQAVISHAVTKGLDPNVPMKDSGIEWLGEVPEHWVVCSARRIIRAVEQGWSPECEANPADEDAWGVLKAGCVNRGVFNPSENKTLPTGLEPISAYEVRAGDILMSRASGSPELVGSTALLGEVRERLMLSDKIFRIYLERKVSSSFFVWVMNAQFMRAQIEQALSGGNGLANNLPQSSLLAFWLAVPPRHEQDAITEYINELTGGVDELISQGNSAVELLQERRSALISAAVTGKIDVRDWQPHPEQAVA